MIKLFIRSFHHYFYYSRYEKLISQLNNSIGIGNINTVCALLYCTVSPTGTFVSTTPEQKNVETYKINYLLTNK